jgi:protocatechuate 3,4-dioxygenase alpha subunit
MRRTDAILTTTPSQTVGPFFEIGLSWESGPYAISEGGAGAITIAGVLWDGAGEPVPDGLIETWQADAAGRFADLHDHGGPSAIDGFRGFARCATDGDGGYRIVTVKPGTVSGPDGSMQAPHVNVSVFARGMLNRCVTRAYFADEWQANAADPVLASIPAARRATLLARPNDDGYRFDIRLQGPDETVFFDV